MEEAQPRRHLLYIGRYCQLSIHRKAVRKICRPTGKKVKWSLAMGKQIRHKISAIISHFPCT